MDYQYNPNHLTSQPTQPPKASGFAIASLSCGIASLVCCCVGLGLPLGALAILFAVLNRRKGKEMNAMSVTGLITGIIGLVLGIGIYISSMSIYADPDFQQSMYGSFKEIYGEEYADIMAEIYGWDLDELK